MSALNSDLSFLGQEVPLGRVDKALKELWGADDARTKASLMNFAIYSEDIDSLQANTDLLSEITEEHACRGLLILAQPGAEAPRARAWITAHCQLHDAHKSVCSEQVSFVLEGGRGNQVRNIVFAHLDSDLPLVCWWQGDLTDNFDERFYSVMDLLFVDSSKWTDPVCDFARLEEAKKDSRFSLYDLSWLRSHLFRTALATCFQSQQALAELARLNKLHVVHAPGHRLAGLLLVAWVGVRLKAELEVGGHNIQLVLLEGQRISVTLAEGGSDEPLQAIALSSDTASFEVKRACKSSYVSTRVTLGSTVHEEMLPADLPTDAALISNLLSRLGRQSLYYQMVPMLQKMLQA